MGMRNRLEVISQSTSFLLAIGDRALAALRTDPNFRPEQEEMIEQVLLRALVDLYCAGQRDPEQLERYAVHRAHRP
jgi:hypothetical protein